MTWTKGNTKYSLHWFCFVIDQPNEADLLIVYGWFYLNGKWNWGWPEVI